MKKFIHSVITVLILAVWSACLPAADSDSNLKTLVIHTSGGQQLSYHIEVADTDATRRRGLMYRQHMPADQGMLLDFGGNHNVGIWMKNTYISLDIIFIDAGGRIVYIYPDATPLSTRTISTGQSVRAVLELNGGQARDKGIAPGDEVVFPTFTSEK